MDTTSNSIYHNKGIVEDWVSFQKTVTIEPLKNVVLPINVEVGNIDVSKPAQAGIYRFGLIVETTDGDFTDDYGSDEFTIQIE